MPVQCISRHVRKVRSVLLTSSNPMRLLVSYRNVSFKLDIKQMQSITY
jgi:hypothetical protein